MKGFGAMKKHQIAMEIEGPLAMWASVYEYEER